MKRLDLLALEDQKLAALANIGLVKRAHKMLEKAYEIDWQEDGTVVFEQAGVTTRLTPGTSLKDSPCSCGSITVCRHRVAAVLAYRSLTADVVPVLAWSPGQLDETILGSKVLQAARRLLRAGLAVELRWSDPPTALLPTCSVSFLAPDQLAHARCDCRQGSGCEHLVLAVWAFRQAEPGQARVVLGQTEQEALEGLHDLATELLRDGVGQPPVELESRLALLRTQHSQKVWLVDLLHEVQATVNAYRERSALYQVGSLPSLLTELVARHRASRAGALPESLTWGQGLPQETPLGHIRLVSLGVRFERLGDQVGCHVYLADPASSTVVRLEKTGPGIRLEDLASGQLVTQTAVRRADRRLILKRSRVGRSSVLAQTGRWDELFSPPLLVENYAELENRLQQLPPWFLRPRVVAEQVYVVAVRSVEEVVYDPGAQRLRAVLRDSLGQELELAADYKSESPGALSSLAASLRSQPRFVSGDLRLEQGRLVLEPLAVALSDRVVAIELEPDRGLDCPRVSLEQAESEQTTLLLACRELLDQVAHQGLRFLTRVWCEQALERSRQLRQLGLVHLGSQLERLADSVCGDRSQAARIWFDCSLRLELTLELARSRCFQQV